MVCLQSLSRGLLPAGAARYAAAVTRPGPVLWPGARALAEHALQVQQVASSTTCIPGAAARLCLTASNCVVSRQALCRAQEEEGWNLTWNPLASLAPVSQPAGGISGGPSPNAGTQVPNEILAFLISANHFYADDWAVAAAAAAEAGENSDRSPSQALKRQKAGPK
jgi:hypothetical protein